MINRSSTDSAGPIPGEIGRGDSPLLGTGLLRVLLLLVGSSE